MNTHALPRLLAPILGCLALAAPTAQAQTIDVGDARMAGNVIRAETAGVTYMNSRPPERLGQRAVHARVAEPLANGCSYVSTVDGRVRDLEERTQRWRGRLLYRPHLTVRSEISCPGRVTQPVRETRLPVRPMTAERLEREIARRGAGDALSASGKVCSYSPAYAVVDGAIAARGVRRDCGE
jgi:hypothetical protein